MYNMVYIGGGLGGDPSFWVASVLLCSGNNSISVRVYFQPPLAVHCLFLLSVILPPFFSSFIFCAAPNSFSSFLLVLPFFHPYFCARFLFILYAFVACCAAGLYRSEDTRAWTLVIIHQSEMLI